MKGDIIYEILDSLEDQSIDLFDFTSAFITAGYGASMSKIEYEYKIKSKQRFSHQIERDRLRRLQKYIYKLKKDGLILENSSKEIKLSTKGKTKLGFLKKNKLVDKNEYKKEVGNKLIIVSYDIPIQFNKERNILRDLLKVLGLNLIHKSVWMGKVKIPREFIVALEKMGILKFVEILEVTKNGSLKSL